MAKELQAVSLGAVGFLGVNSMDPPLQQSPEYAETANNAVIDRYGRLGARKGFNKTSTNESVLQEQYAEHLAEWSQPDGTLTQFVMGNDKIFRLDTTTEVNDTLTEMNFPGGYTPTGSKWSCADFNGELYFFQKDNPPLMVNTTSNGSDNLVTVDSESAEAAPNAPEAGIVIAAYGRLWAADITGEETLVYFSDTLIGDGWTEGSSGSLDLNTVWPSGYDKVTGLAAHNQRLIMFGQNAFVVYDGATIPASMQLEDAVAGVGCVYHESIQNTGNDIVFLSYTGVKSLKRTVLQNTLPEFDLTANIRDKLVQAVRSEEIGVTSVYSPEESMYCIHFKTESTTFYIDMKVELEEGKRRCTVWPASPFRDMYRSDDGTLHVCGMLGVGTYDGYIDADLGYLFEFYGPYLTFGDPSRIKVLKSMTLTMSGGNAQDATLFWGFGFSTSYNSQSLGLADQETGYYGVSEFNSGAEYAGGVTVTEGSVNTTGSGEIVRVGVAVNVNGKEFSLQQLRVYVIMGRIV